MPNPYYNKLKFLTILLFMFLSNNVLAQNQSNYYGKEFYLSFLQNYTTPTQIIFSISSESPKNIINISILGNTSTFNIFRKDTFIVFNSTTTPRANQFIIDNLGSELPQNRSVFVQCINPITLTVINNALNSTESAMVIPVEFIPKNPIYFINTYRGYENIGIENNSEFVIVAIDDNCKINILQTAESKYGKLANSPYTINLRKGQAYQVQAKDSQSFSGTKIWNTDGCKKFVVFEGVKSTFVDFSSNCSGFEHLYNQTKPIQYLGNNYTLFPIAKMSNGYYYQIVVTENNTNIKIDGTSIATLNQGDVYQVNQNTNKTICVEADKKISVNLLLKSGICNGNPLSIGNPSMTSIIPDFQKTTKSSFRVPETIKLGTKSLGPSEAYVVVVCNKNEAKYIQVNNSAIDTSNIIYSCDQSVIQFPAQFATTYNIKSEKGFIAYLYAFSNEESYATEVASSFENNISKFELQSGIDKTCDSSFNFIMKTESDSSATFKWNFSDGSSLSGDSINKVFNKIGKYKVQLVVQYTNNIGCLADTFYKDLTVYPTPKFNLGKDSIYCKGEFITIKPFVNARSKFLWYDNSTQSNVVISESKQIWLTITDTNNCKFTDTLDLKFINCDTNSLRIGNVFTPNLNGGDEHNDEFKIELSGFDLLDGIIYNRWGEVVHQFKLPNGEFWNGGYKNNIVDPCPTGVYYYIFNLKNSKTNLTKTINGVVQLIR